MSRRAASKAKYRQGERMEALVQFAEELEAEEYDSYSCYDCPICGSPNDEWGTCGCYAEVHYGKD